MVLPDGIIWIPNGAIKQEKRLSGGSYGETHTCFVRGSPFFDKCILYCVKQYKAHSQTIVTTERDREILASRVRHLGVVEAIGVSIDSPPVALFPYWNGGSFQSFSLLIEKEKRNSFLSAGEIRRIEIFRKNFSLICSALWTTLEAVHSADILHCDLHIGNIFFHFEGDKVYVGLGDWGMAQTVEMAYSALGHKWHKKDTDQFGHIAPELKAPKPIVDQPYTKATNVYALGFVIRHMLSRNALITQSIDYAQLQALKNSIAWSL
ncbi:hypothetical protein R1flu_006866 [Riccia fluitans]|uniref:Protein kinase domain-containing protein n=1 Tax=Riccia fluitans TaxID=41844 RepID=A0ABD1YX76_9MARC